MASPLSALLGSNPSSGAPALGQNNNTAGSSALANSSNEQMFLQLLVSQLKNQDPTNPVDGTQFVSELSQFSQVEQLIAIRSDIETSMAANSNPSASGNPASGTPASGSPPSNTPGTTPAGTNPSTTQN